MKRKELRQEFPLTEEERTQIEPLKEKPRCPESKQTVYYPVPRCNLNDKPCVLESGYTCPYEGGGKVERL